jgi:tetraacyldisaccharide 4'-kinase
VTLERHWQRITLVSLMLYPVSLIFRFLVWARRGAYALSLFKRERLDVPVIIIGNITTGGTGKTPLVLWIAHYLVRHGMKPGIVSRGYGGDTREARAVRPTADPAQFGDEPVLLAQRSGCPVWVGADRVAAARGLRAANHACNVLLSDDGLQHYRLHRDVEVAVVDGERGFGNGFMMPAGPLREPQSRLREVDAVVVNGGPHATNAAPIVFRMRLEGSYFHNLLDPSRIVDAGHFHGKPVLAVAGIGYPPRFFSQLRTLGVAFEPRAFADHHAYVRSDLDTTGGGAVVMTEKDAVKCAAFASENYWALRVAAAPEAALGELMLRKLGVTSLT